MTSVQISSKCCKQQQPSASTLPQAKKKKTHKNQPKRRKETYMKPIHPTKPPPIPTPKQLQPPIPAHPLAMRIDLFYGLDPIALPRDSPLGLVEGEEIAFVGVVEDVAAEEVAECPPVLLLDTFGEVGEDEVGAEILVEVFPFEAGVVVVGVFGGVLGGTGGGGVVADDPHGLAETVEEE